MKEMRTWLKWFLPVFMLLFLTGCGEKEVKKTIFAMDTVMELTAYGGHAEDALTEAIRTINEAAGELDPEQPGSMAYQLNHGNGQEMEISERIYQMLETTDFVYSGTDGALDLSVYPVVKAWGLIDQNYRVPSESEIVSALERVDYSSVTWRTDGTRYYATVPEGMEVSFGAVAKGAVAEAVMETLAENGVTRAFVSLGGNVQTMGKKSDGEDWSIAVADPKDASSYLGVLNVNGAVVTSGSYQRCFEQDGKFYHHIIDPSTGYPADNGLVSVTVICQNGMLADCLSTALFVLGEEDALAYWRDYDGEDLELVLVTEDDRVVVTQGLKDRFTPHGERYTYEFAD